MDISRAADVAPIEVHRQVRTWRIVAPGSVRAETEGGFLDGVSEFEVAPGGEVTPHRHNTHEYYYVLAGRPVVWIGAEETTAEPGDLVHVPPQVAHGLTNQTDAPARLLTWAVSFQPPGVRAEVAERPAVVRSV